MEQSLQLNRVTQLPKKGEKVIVLELTDIQLHSNARPTQSVGGAIRRSIENNKPGRIFSSLEKKQESSADQNSIEFTMPFAMNDLWEMYSILFTKQSEWSEQQVANQDQFEKYAGEAGVANIEQWKKDVVSDEVKNRVEDSYKEAVSLNLQGTPSFFLNGKKIENPKGYESFKLLIEKAKNN